MNTKTYIMQNRYDNVVKTVNRVFGVRLGNKLEGEPPNGGDNQGTGGCYTPELSSNELKN